MNLITIKCPYCERTIPLVISTEIETIELRNTKTLMEKLNNLDLIVVDILKFSRRGIEVKRLYKAIREIYGISKEEFYAIIELMKRDGLLMCPKVGIISSTI